MPRYKKPRGWRKKKLLEAVRKKDLTLAIALTTTFKVSKRRAKKLSKLKKIFNQIKILEQE